MTDNSKKYVKLNHREHILQRPDTYVGSITNEKKTIYLAQDINKIYSKEIDYNPGFFTIFNEILTNAADHSIRTNKVKFIKINVTEESVSIENDGPGIPVEMHSKEKVYIPELVFGHFLTSENYDDSINRTWGGRNGYGAKLTNVFSTKFIVETADGKMKYKQEFFNNMDKKTKPSISKSNKNYTRITYYPDFEKFEMTKITDEIQAIFLKRAIDIGAYNPNIKIFYNNSLIPIKTFKDYMKMFIDEDNELFYEKLNDNWEIGVSKSQTDNFQQVSMVNGISTIIGGSHVNFISNLIVKALAEKIEKSSKVNVKPGTIKNHLFVFINCKMSNPSFETQTKDNLTSKMTSDIVKNIELSESFIKKLATSDIKNDIVNFATLKEFQDAKKQTVGGQRTKVKIAKLDDANKAGKPTESAKCSLFLTEGDCLHEDTEIIIIRNGQKINIKIKDVKLDDAVITHKNNIDIIKNISKKIEKIVKIKLANEEILLCSEKHRWYVYDKIDNKFLFLETKNIDKNRHKMVINKNTFFDDFIKIIEMEKIKYKNYDYILTLTTGDVYSSKNHKFSVFDSIDYKFLMIECKNLNKNRHFIVSYEKI